jgi:hypothetical protein
MLKKSLSVVFGILLGLTLLSCGGLGDGSGTDQYEPNDELQLATPLEPGTAVRASISRGGSAGDRDVFQCDASKSGGLTKFRVVLESDGAENLKVEVAASIPGAFEGITWPGWQPRRSGNSITVPGELKTGTVLIFVSGSQPADYSVRVVWE